MHEDVHHVMLNIVSTCVVVDSHDTRYVYSLLIVTCSVLNKKCFFLVHIQNTVYPLSFLQFSAHFYRSAGSMIPARVGSILPARAGKVSALLD